MTQSAATRRVLRSTKIIDLLAPIRTAGRYQV